MEEKMICDIALQEGFDNAIYMDVEDLSFEPELRKYCEDNVCGNYNNNYACPPYCGTPEEMEKRAKKYKRALILQTIHQVTDIKDIEQTKNFQKIHNQKTMDLIEKMTSYHEKCLPIMAGPCTLCEQCSKRENKPCHLLETPASCLSAYCINAQKMTEHCKIPYRCDNNQIAFFSILLKDMREINEMTIDEILTEKKNSLHIHEYGFIKTENLVVSEQVRKLCADNVCGCFGKTWACPPGVGTLSECEQKMKAYENVFVFTTKHDLEDSFDWEGMMRGKQEHEKMEPEVVALFREYFEDIMVLSTEGCQKCEQCTYPDEPCRFPQKLHPSIESYGVEVNRLAKSAGVHYINGKNTVTYFSCIFF